LRIERKATRPEQLPQDLSRDRGVLREQQAFEAAGFSVMRSAASKGPVDLIAWSPTWIRFVSVKTGSAYATEIERESLRLMPRPTNSTIEIWRFPDRRPPRIERL
jgi:hypothetical protein